MKFISLYHIKNNFNFYLLSISENKKRWGRVDNSFINFFCYKNFAIIDPLKIFINLKKVVWIAYKLANEQVITLIFFNKNLKNFYNKEFDQNVDNFYVLMFSKLFGFITSFSFFIDRISDLKKKKITNYSRTRPPSLVFLTKKCWKIYSGIFKFFLKLRIISIKSLSYNDVELNPGYSIIINDCSLVYSLIKYIYKLSNKFILKW